MVFTSAATSLRISLAILTPSIIFAGIRAPGLGIEVSDRKSYTGEPARGLTATTRRFSLGRLSRAAVSSSQSRRGVQCFCHDRQGSVGNSGLSRVQTIAGISRESRELEMPAVPPGVRGQGRHPSSCWWTRRTTGELSRCESPRVHSVGVLRSGCQDPLRRPRGFSLLAQVPIANAKLALPDTSTPADYHAGFLSTAKVPTLTHMRRLSARSEPSDDQPEWWAPSPARVACNFPMFTGVYGSNVRPVFRMWKQCPTARQPNCMQLGMAADESQLGNKWSRSESRGDDGLHV